MEGGLQKNVRNQEGWGIKGQQRVDCEKSAKLRGWTAKNCAKLRGLGH